MDARMARAQDALERPDLQVTHRRQIFFQGVAADLAAEFVAGYRVVAEVDAEVDARHRAFKLSRPDRPTLRLSPITADGLFAVDGIDRLRVRFTGQTLELLRAGEPAPRVFTRG